MSDKITYFEERTINIGNYESIKFGFTYGTHLKRFNKKEQTVSISELQTVTVAEDDQDFKDTVKQLQTRVRGLLNKRETSIRMRSSEFVDEYHATILKGMMLGALSPKAVLRDAQVIVKDEIGFKDLLGSLDDNDEKIESAFDDE